MCRTDGSVYEKQVHALFGIVRLADVARNLSFKIARSREKDSRTRGLDDRTLLSARYRSNDRLAVIRNVEKSKLKTAAQMNKGTKSLDWIDPLFGITIGGAGGALGSALLR